jgi:hypothetical protein
LIAQNRRPKQTRWFDRARATFFYLVRGCTILVSETTDHVPRACATASLAQQTGGIRQATPVSVFRSKLTVLFHSRLTAVDNLGSSGFTSDDSPNHSYVVVRDQQEGMSAITNNAKTNTNTNTNTKKSTNTNTNKNTKPTTNQNNTQEHT